MPFTLRSGLYYAECQDDIILLDVKQDRYFALPRASHTAFHALLQDQEQNADGHGDLVTLLEPKGDTAPAGRGAPVGSTLAYPIGRLPRQAHAPGLSSLSKAFAYRVMASARLRLLSLDQIVGALERKKRRLTDVPHNHDEAAKVARAYEWITPFFLMEDRCMAISIGLMSALLDRKIPATLAIGVRTAPFSAHCWVQLGSHLVNEELETVQRFTPILAV